MTDGNLTPVQEVRDPCLHPVEHVAPALLAGSHDGNRIVSVTGCCQLCEGTCPLFAEEAVRCSGAVDIGGGESDGCGAPSRYVVARSDGDETYGINGGSDECCAAHLEDTILGMADGDDNVSLIVAIRWDAPDTTKGQQ